VICGRALHCLPFSRGFSVGCSAVVPSSLTHVYASIETKT
jgi:hypothetical protein